MGRVSEADIAAIRENADILEIVGREINLTPSGREYIGLCPFHQDHRPSLHVNPGKGIYKCFSCGAGGDVFRYVTQRTGMNFLDAVRYVAETQGIAIQFTAEDKAREAERTEIYKALEIATRLFQRNLSHSSQAQDYLYGKRKITDETAKEFRIGFAPDEWESLIQSIGPDSNTGLSLETLQQAGLIRAREGNRGFYDYFRGRLIFPVTDLAGRIVGFAGRGMAQDSIPKYLNSPENPVFSKSRILFGLSQASRQIRETRRAIVVEGYLDAIAGQQAGLPIIATCGTALTEAQAEILNRRFPGLEIILAFDGDDAGRRATLKASTQLLGEANASVCLMPEGKDPDEILLAQGAPGQTLFDSARGGREMFEQLLSQRVLAFDYYLSERLKGRNLKDPGDTSRLLREVASDFRRIPGDVLPIYVTALSERTGIDPDSINQAVSGDEYERHRGGAIPPRDQCEADLLHGLMLLPAVVERFRGIVTEKLFTSPERRAVANYLLRGGDVDSVHTPLLQQASAAAESIIALPGNADLRPHVLHRLLSPPSAAARRNLKYYELAYRLIRGWEAFQAVSQTGEKGHSIDLLGPLVSGLEEAIRASENIGHWRDIKDLPGARIIDKKYLLIQRTWTGEELPKNFGGLGEYLLQHASGFTTEIGRSPVTDIAADHNIASVDVEDGPEQLFSISGTTFKEGTLANTTFFARCAAEEPNILAGFIPPAARKDRIITFRGAHDMAALRRGVARHFGDDSSYLPQLSRMNTNHRDVSVFLAGILNGRTIDRSLRSAEKHLFGYDRKFDPPSEQIPRIYAEFLRTGDPTCVEKIVSHTITDTISPLAILHLASVT